MKAAHTHDGPHRGNAAEKEAAGVQSGLEATMSGGDRCHQWARSGWRQASCASCSSLPALRHRCMTSTRLSGSSRRRR